MSFSFPVVHLSQWLDRWEELESLACTNPFAVVIMAQLQALRHHGAQRVGLAVSLLRLVEWMLRLPKDQEPACLAALKRVKQERKMGYVMIAERLGMEKGQALGEIKGQAKFLLRQIERRFGPMAAETTKRIQSARSATWNLGR